MSTEEWAEFTKRTRAELVAEFQLRFPQLTAAEAEGLAVEVENAGLVLIDRSIRHGVNVGFDSARKANRVTLFIRTVVVTFMAPLFVTAGANIAGQNSLGLIVGGLIAATLFLVGDEAINSLGNLFKKEKKDAK